MMECTPSVTGCPGDTAEGAAKSWAVGDYGSSGDG